jgi:dehydrogenase/reductase SDR family member 7
MWAYVTVAAAVVLLALFFKSDTDLPLFVAPYEQKNSFAGKVVWITGASSGIGAALAEDMVKAGAKVIISARRVAQLEKVADSCAKVGERPFVLPLDVVDFTAHQEAYAVVLRNFGIVDSLVLNAGQTQRNTALDTDLAVTQDLMNLNFMSYVALTKLVLPDMLRRKDGQIVVTSSLSGIIGTPLGSSYSATKFALHGYFNALRAEVFMQGINVLIVCPGPVESEIADKAHRNPNLPVAMEEEKMPTSRCSILMAKAMYYRLMEVWISQQPLLLVTYIAQYAPTLSNFVFSKIVGPARVKVLHSGSGNLFDIKQLLNAVAE